MGPATMYKPYVTSLRVGCGCWTEAAQRRARSRQSRYRSGGRWDCLSVLRARRRCLGMAYLAKLPDRVIAGVSHMFRRGNHILKQLKGLRGPYCLSGPWTKPHAAPPCRVGGAFGCGGGGGCHGSVGSGGMKSSALTTRGSAAGGGTQSAGSADITGSDGGIHAARFAHGFSSDSPGENVESSLLWVRHFRALFFRFTDSAVLMIVGFTGIGEGALVPPQPSAFALFCLCFCLVLLDITRIIVLYWLV